MKAVILTIIAIIIIMTIIISVGFNLNPANKEDRKVLTKETTLWLKSVGNNFKNLVGLTVQQRWAPDLNESRLNKSESKSEEDNSSSQEGRK